MVEELRALVAFSRQLNPDAEERLSLAQSVIQYVESFLNVDLALELLRRRYSIREGPE